MRRQRTPIIAFDGPDNVGKGTQIALLRKWLSHIPFVLTNLDRPHGKNHDEKLDYGYRASRNHLRAKELLWREGIPHLVDRMHYTEYAYSILRGGHLLENILTLEQAFLTMRDDFLTIIFVDEVENILKRDDGLSVYKRDDYEAVENIIKRFHEIAEASHFHNRIISITGKSIPQVHEEVREIVRAFFPKIETEECSLLSKK